jgi:pyruvate/2-oxoglutarate/acetoin dehydrogenase E1 component
VAQRELTFVEALNEGLREEMRRDSSIILMGESISGGMHGVTKDLIREFGAERVRDTPISESSFIGAGVGSAMLGFRPVVELMYVDFFGVAMDQIYNQAAKTRYMFGGKVKVPLTIRTAFGAGLHSAATHSQTLYSIFAHVPGLKVVVPSTPYDAKGLLISSLRDDDPKVFMEHKLLYRVKSPVPEGQYTVPLGEAAVRRSGRDVTIIALAFMVQKSLEAASRLAEEGVEAEVVDPRTIVPFDRKCLLSSIKKTGRLVVVDEDYERCGFSAEMAAIAASDGFEYLKAPVRRVAMPNVPIPYSPKLESHVLPGVEKIVQAAREVVGRRR